MVYLMTGWPQLSVAELMQITEGQLPCQDVSLFELNAMRLVVQSMLVYERVMTSQMHA